MSFPIQVIRRTGSFVLMGVSLALGACGSDASTGTPADAGHGGPGTDGSFASSDGAAGSDGSSASSDAGNEDAGGSGDAGNSGDAGGGSGGQSGDVCDPNHDTCAAPLKCCPTNLPTKSTCQSTGANGGCIPRP